MPTDLDPRRLRFGQNSDGIGQSKTARREHQRRHATREREFFSTRERASNASYIDINILVVIKFVFFFAKAN
jgi:hypothetical protein